MTAAHSEGRPAAPLAGREFTIRAFILGVLLTALLGAANVYLGLYVGLTVSASIPAAVLSMALLSVMRNPDIRENNIVQSMASAGESLAAGVIFTIPALVLTKQWTHYEYWPTTAIAVVGGVLGVLIMVPLRKTLIDESPGLKYPEGVACAEVLRSGESPDKARAIVAGLGVGLLFKSLSEKGFGLIKDSVAYVADLSGRIGYFGMDVSPAMMGVGYILGLRISLLLVFGGVFGWNIVMPLIDAPEVSTDAAGSIWSSKIRYIGVGAMLVAGLYAIWQVRRSFSFLKPGSNEAHLTRGDMQAPILLGLVAAGGAGVFAIFIWQEVPFPAILFIGLAVFAAVVLFVAVASYITGLVGSSHSPVSGMTICGLLLIAGVTLLTGLSGPILAGVILTGAGVVCCAACTSGDIAQDLKTGRLVGATPRYQQWAELVGVIAAAFLFAPILDLLDSQYGIGTGAQGSLRAPQATLFASITESFAGTGELPWDYFMLGVVLALFIIPVDIYLKKKDPHSLGMPPMPVAVGIYLPVSISVPILAGALIRHFWDNQRGILAASGLIAGEALAGIGLAALSFSGAGLKLVSEPYPLLGIGLFVVLAFSFARFWARD